MIKNFFKITSSSVSADDEKIIYLRKKTKMLYFISGIMLIILNIFGISIREKFDIYSILYIIRILIIMITNILLISKKTKLIELTSIILMIIIVISYLIV